MDENFNLSAANVRSGRALLQWSQSDLAQRAGVAISTIADFEKGLRVPIANNVSAIQRALELAGVRFTSGDASLTHSLHLFFMSSENAAEVGLHFTDGAVHAVHDVLSVFGKVQGSGAAVEVEAVQSASKALKASLDDLVIKHGRAAPPLHRLKKFVHSLRDGEYFLLLPEPAASTAEKLEYENLLYRLNHQGEKGDRDGMQVLFGALLERYDIELPRTDRQTVIGGRNRNRKCRFCHRTKSEGATFERVAHAISTALGNDFLKLADQCDDCNDYFGKETEPSLIAMLNIQRAFLGIQGRGKNNGRPELRFAEGTIFHDGEKMNITAKSVSRDNKTNIISVRLGKGESMIPAAAYRALVQFALSVVDERHLPFLTKTIEWLREGKHVDRILPSVAATILDFPPNPSAQITLYSRKTEQSRLPHIIGEFRLGCYIYVFAVPFSDRDSWDLIGFFDDSEFQDTFKHYAAVKTWSQHDLNGRDEVAISPHIKFVPKSM